MSQSDNTPSHDGILVTVGGQEFFKTAKRPAVGETVYAIDFAYDITPYVIQDVAYKTVGGYAYYTVQEATQ